MPKLDNLTHSSPVRIVETGQVFASQQECAAALNGRQGAISNCLRGNRQTYRGYHFERVEMTPYLSPHSPAELVETLKLAESLMARTILVSGVKRDRHVERLQALIRDCERQLDANSNVG